MNRILAAGVCALSIGLLSGCTASVGSSDDFASLTTAPALLPPPALPADPAADAASATVGPASPAPEQLITPVQDPGFSAGLAVPGAPRSAQPLTVAEATSGLNTAAPMAPALPDGTFMAAALPDMDAFPAAGAIVPMSPGLVVADAPQVTVATGNGAAAASPSPDAGLFPAAPAASAVAATGPSIASPLPDETAQPVQAATESAPATAASGLAAKSDRAPRGLFATLFGQRGAKAAQPAQPVQADAAAQILTASPAQADDPEDRPQVVAMTALPGVDTKNLFGIGEGGVDEELYDDHPEETVQLASASAAGLARLAPNGILKQTDRVEVNCFKPELVKVLKSIERQFGKKLVVTSGYRSPRDNRRSGGSRRSLHMYCAAADIQVPGVGKWELAKFLRAMPGRGGVGTYCHTDSVHIDIGSKRDWNWRCRRRK
ncbi:MAG: D-Ala-D-Ala carboxypeptidase family metallohydrolase [Rhizobiaceae bacterium]|nr:D-Ala-D-Ala carboxypeptidase family metallohydrolase [Rhizobiaceae bacterium]